MKCAVIGPQDLGGASVRDIPLRRAEKGRPIMVLGSGLPIMISVLLKLRFVLSPSI